MAVYTPLCWVRKIEKFNAFHILADFLIMLTIIIILIFAFMKIKDDGFNSGIEAINNETFLDVVSFAVYCYEGIGVVIPVMEITEKPEIYPKILMAVMTTVFVGYTLFGEFCYFVWGDEI